MPDSTKSSTRPWGRMIWLFRRAFRWRLTTMLLIAALLAIGISALSIAPIRNARLRAYGCALALDRSQFPPWGHFVSMLLPEDLIYPLKTISYDGGLIDPQDRMPLSALSYCFEVENLRLVGIQPGELSKLPRLPNLKLLNVANSSMNPSDIAALSLQPELEQLHLHYCHLKGRPSQTATSRSNVVKYLRLDNSTIEPQCIPTLASFTQLEEMLTVNVQFKDEHWLQFPPLPNLHFMQLRITEERPLPAGVDKNRLFPKMHAESPYYGFSTKIGEERLFF